MRKKLDEPKPDRVVPFRDIDGFGVFAGGDAGAAHMLAHTMLDEERFEEGYAALGDWLRCNRGEGSEWVHLQWHMAVFEIATGRIADAVERFERHIVASVVTHEALTDGPSLLWRLALADPERSLDWGTVRAAAVTAPEGGLAEPWIELHHLLALAGSGDRRGLDERLDRLMQAAPRSRSAQTLLQFGWGLRTYASRHYEVAAKLLAQCAELSSSLGGSHAQNELFLAIARQANRQAGTAMADEAVAA